MLILSPSMRAVLAREPAPKATPDDIARIRALQPLSVPDSYIELVTQHGCPVFEAGDPGVFDYSYTEPGFSMKFKGSISHFMTPERVGLAYKGLVLDEAEDLPKFPAFMLPIGLDFGQSTVLLECGGESDRIWFWEFQWNPWGEGINVRLGKVAPTLQAFLDKLYLKPL